MGPSSEAVEAAAKALGELIGARSPYALKVRTEEAKHALAAALPIIRREWEAEQMCHNGHRFEPGIDVDMIDEGRSPDPRWCNVCGEGREVSR
jgi:hypothetical protein